MILGNHDKPFKSIPCFDKMILAYNNKHILLVHDPAKIKASWKGWTIHGHTHNHDLFRYPIFNPDRRTINVSVELINYQPLDLDIVMKMIRLAGDKKLGKINMISDFVSV